MKKLVLALSVALAACATTTASTEHNHHDISTAGIASTWDDARINQILERTQRLHLAPDMSALSAGEREAVRELLLAGERMHELYLGQRHPQARAAAAWVAEHPANTAVRDLASSTQPLIARALPLSLSFDQPRSSP